MGRVPAADRERIIQSFEDGEDFIETARIKNVCHTPSFIISLQPAEDLFCRMQVADLVNLMIIVLIFLL